MVDYKSMTKAELIDELERRDAESAPAPASPGMARIVIRDNEFRTLSVNADDVPLEPGVPTEVPEEYLPVLDFAKVPYTREDK